MSVFKAYDIRGLYGTEITEDFAYQLGKAFVHTLQCNTVVVGHDMRDSSKPLHRALCKGITEQGANVIDIGLATTPLFYFSCKDTAGIMITASHNPAQYNGFKLVDAQGNPLYAKHKLDEIEKNMQASFAAQTLGTITQKNNMQEYLSFFLDKAKNIKPYTLVLDTGNGMGGLTHKQFYEQLGCTVHGLYLEPNGNFPHHEPNPMKAENREAAREKLLEKKADLAVLTDGDADRIMFLDEQGQVVPADYLIALLVQELLKTHPGAAFVYDLRCSKIVQETIEKHGGKAYSCRVGNPFLKELMHKHNAIFAGELSAHFMYAETNYHESSLYTALLVLQIMSTTGKKLSELIAPFKKYPKMEEENFTVADTEKILDALAKHYAGYVSTEDGIKITFPSWWCSVRASNTEPLLRLNMEADTELLLAEKKKEIVSIITS